MSQPNRSEAARVDALKGLNLLDTAPESQFDEITRLATLVLGVHSSAISLIDEERQWFKSRVGIPFCGTSRDEAFCVHSVNARAFLEVPDATLDDRFRNNPLVTSDGGIRYYAGTPLILSSGHCVGTLCVFDGTVRSPMSPEQREALDDLARLTVQRIESREQRLFAEVAARIVQATPDAVLAVGDDGIITMWNRGASAMFGYGAVDALGQSLDLVLPESAGGGDQRHGFVRAVPGGLAALIGSTVELVGRRADGRDLPIELSLSRWEPKEDESSGGYAVIIRDISARKALVDEGRGLAVLSLGLDRYRAIND